MISSRGTVLRRSVAWWLGYVGVALWAFAGYGFVNGANSVMNLADIARLAFPSAVPAETDLQGIARQFLLYGVLVLTGVILVALSLALNPSPWRLRLFGVLLAALGVSAWIVVPVLLSQVMIATELNFPVDVALNLDFVTQSVSVALALMSLGVTFRARPRSLLWTLVLAIPTVIAISATSREALLLAQVIAAAAVAITAWAGRGVWVTRRTKQQSHA